MLSKNQVREIRSLHLKKFREARQLFIAEGSKMVSEIIGERPELIQSVYADAAFLSRFSAELTKKKVAFTEVSEEELRNISLQSNPQHVLAVCRQQETRSALPVPKGICFYLDDIRDPGNFGTIIRICDWFGITHLYCSPECCELYNPKVIQSSMGAFLRVGVHYASLTEVLQKGKPQRIYGAVMEGKDIYREKLQGGVILIGNEANGISAENLKLVNRPITIPAHRNNGSESLNAAMATGIIAAEFFRQTRGD